MDEDLHDVARALARVTAALPGGGETRTGQVAMAEAVAHAIASRRHLVVQAGTGTGKSLGYLVPALLSGSRVVVATATKALQDQLAGKDLPFLAEHLGTRFAFAVLKGRSNYFCWQRARELAADGGQLLLDDGMAAAARTTDEVRRILEWAEGTSSGDRAELSFEPTPAAWSAVSVSAAECPGAGRCPSGEACFAEAARQKAAQADVIVVNTHLYGQHVRSGGYVLPEHDVVVFDEAHEVEDVFADSLGMELGAGRFGFLAGRARAIVTDLDRQVDLVDAGGRLEEALEPWAGKRLESGPAGDSRLAAVLTLAIDRVNKALGVLRKVPDDAAGTAAARKIRAVQAATSLLEELHEAADPATPLRRARRGGDGADGSDPGADPFDDTVDRLEDASAFPAVDRVAWVEPGGPTRGPVLRIAPIEVAPTLAAALWPDRTAILTSATIPANLAPRLGLPAERTDVLDAGSPFDYGQNALLYCATKLPDPRNPGYEPAMHRELEALLRAAGGRTLALFTSWRAMRAAAAAMSDAGLPFRILTQSDLPKPALAAAFSDDETSCLFATMGMWQGIDVPGRSLSLVVIDRLPFSRPDEPLLVARRERAGARAFELIDLPRAATLLAQGAGRLIRTATDRGVVAVLDPRLNSARYRWDLVRALPPMRRTRHRDEVERFLHEIVA